MVGCNKEEKSNFRFVSRRSAGTMTSEMEESLDHREDFPDFKNLVRRKLTSLWTKETAYRRIPVLQWAPKYNFNSLISDCIAGITVGLTSIPQSIAYATVANLEPQYGLYSNFIGSFVYAMLGSVKEITVAPTAVMALMVQQPVQDLGPAGAVLSSFLSGCIMLLLGCFNFGFVVQFISMPVITGFITAAAFTIISSQLKSLMGISSSGKSSEFVDTWINLYKNIGETRLWDSILGFSSLIVLILLTLIKGRGRGRWKTFTKYLCLLRNAMIVLSGGLIAYVCSTHDMYPFKLTGKVASGLPSLELPPFETVHDGKHYDFVDMIRTLSSSIISIPLISILEIVSIGKAFSRGKLVDATQEMLSLGCCNVAGSFVCSIPTTASFARSAINSSSGVATPFGGVFTGILVLLALGLLTDYFFFIPKTTLAAVIIAAMMFIIEYRAVAEMWRTKRIDIVPFLVTVVACLFLGLEIGIVVGIAVNLCFPLYLASRPRITHRLMNVNDKTVLIVRPDSDLAFSSAEYFREKILKLVTRTIPDVVLIDGEWVKFIDSTVVRNLSSTISDLRQQERHVLLWRWDKHIRSALYRFKKHKFMPLFRNEPNAEEVMANWKPDFVNESFVSNV
ncbi:sodium-independent sulfate anion transporter-like [Anopheles nili]|uniref:sodium-independent sulfate anion transporter-like n=1 Tax=Anopheles nili TaxID=185578 RepID=UPI00237AF11C|nr:sodium-independent sulfate anion transporter-like [Anopheles nili]